jgi:hypothetical protein
MVWKAGGLALPVTVDTILRFCVQHKKLWRICWLLGPLAVLSPNIVKRQFVCGSDDWF